MPTKLTTISPTTTPRGAVVVIQEAFGVTDHIVDICQRFADAGWTAVAPHLFHRLETEKFAYDDLQGAMPAMQSLTASDIDSDVDAAMTSLAELGFEPEQVAIVGFCMGGTVSFNTAVRRHLGAAATFYGGGITEGRFGYPGLADVADALQTPWHGFFGDKDSGIPVEEVEQLRSVAATAPTSTEITRYADAEHGFNCNDRPAVFNEAAAADAFAKTLEWFDTHVAQACLLSMRR